MIIPVKNEGLWIRKTLDSLLHAKTTLPFEVIVVDNGSEDGCCDFLSSNSHDQIQLACEKERGISKARNTGARLAQGDYLIFCDAHLVFEDNWMDHLIEPLQQGIADAINPCIADVQNPNRMGFGYTWGKIYQFSGMQAYRCLFHLLFWQEDVSPFPERFSITWKDLMINSVDGDMRIRKCPSNYGCGGIGVGFSQK